MSPAKLDEIMMRYRSNKARVAYLRSQREMLDRFLSICKSQMINDSVSLSQAITGMPHGSGVGDPVGRLAMDIVSGKVTPFVKQIQEDIMQNERDLQAVEPDVKVVDLVLGAFTERERQVVEMKIFDDLTWPETLSRMNEVHNNTYSKRSLQRLLDRAMGKAYEIVK